MLTSADENVAGEWVVKGRVEGVKRGVSWKMIVHIESEKV